MNTLVLIDGNSLLNRAYYAIRNPMVTSDGIYTHGIFAFLNMLNKIKTDYNPSYIAVAFDLKAPTFRHKEYGEYKAGRKKMPDELGMQFPYLKEILEAMHICILEMEGFEADDLIGTAATRAEAEGLTPLIITGDKDELQLASDKVRVLITKKGISEFEIYDDKTFFEKYGFTPTQFIDYKGLMGDQSDNIPGIPGVGEKTASKLILEYGNVENLIAHAAEIPNEKLRQKVEDNALQAQMSKRLATIITDVPIETDFETMKVRDSDVEKLTELYTKLEFKSFLKKMSVSIEDNIAGDSRLRGNDIRDGTMENDRNTVDGVIPAEAGISDKVAIPIPFATGDTIATQIIRDHSELEEAFDKIESGQTVGFKVFSDDNHLKLPLVYGICIMYIDRLLFIDVSDDSNLINSTAELLVSKKINLVGHNLQADFYAIFALSGHTYDFNVLFDTAIAAYLLDPTAGDYKLAGLALKYANLEVSEDSLSTNNQVQQDLFSDYTTVYIDSGKANLQLILQLHPLINRQIEVEKLTGVLQTAELPLISTLAQMEYMGFTYDGNALSEVSKQVDASIDTITTQVYSLAGEEFNLNSPKQLGIVLFENMGLKYKGKMTSKGGYSTSVDVLEKLVAYHPIIPLILSYRTLAKLRSTYIEGLAPLVASDGKIHAHFRQTVTATGRISCTEPNLQNIPIRQELGREIRRAFVTESDEFTLLGADYSQIELRVLAHLSQDPGMIADFKMDADIHRRTASRVFGVDEDRVTSQQRSAAKVVNFGIIYGMSSFGLSEDLGITPKQAANYIEDYFEHHKAVKDYLDNSVADAKKLGYSETLLGRKRAIPELSSPVYQVRQFGERLAMNTPIQGGAADIMKLAMIKVSEALREAKMRSTLILQVHDELILQVYKPELEAAKKILREGMESVIELSVPLSVSMNTGDSWYELK